MKCGGMSPSIFTKFAPNLGMSNGNLVGTGGHEGSCLTGSFINLDKSSEFNVARNGILGLTEALKVPIWGLEGPAPKFP